MVKYRAKQHSNSGPHSGQAETVILGGYSTTTKAEELEHVETDVAIVVDALVTAKRVKIVPDHGLAVANAQYAIAEMVKVLREKGDIDVNGAIHPVAGCMPGQLNVLIVLKMDDINDEIDHADVCLVIGANYTVSSSAEEDPNSALYGVPLICPWNSKHVYILKRSLDTGYAGAEKQEFRIGKNARATSRTE